MPLGTVTRLCGAKTKKENGEPCANPAMLSGRCRMHRGKATKGAAHYNYKHGRYSKVLPTGLREKVETAHNDEELVTLSHEIALVDGVLQERLEKIYSGESCDWWTSCRMQFHRLKASINQPAKTEEAKTLKQTAIIAFTDQLGASLEHGSQVFNAYDAVKGIIEQRRKLVETESKRLKELDQTITSEKALVVITVLVDIVNRCVTNPQEKKEIADELYLLANKK